MHSFRLDKQLSTPDQQTARTFCLLSSTCVPILHTPVNILHFSLHPFLYLFFYFTYVYICGYIWYVIAQRNANEDMCLFICRGNCHQRIYFYAWESLYKYIDNSTNNSVHDSTWYRNWKTNHRILFIFFFLSYFFYCNLKFFFFISLIRFIINKY